MAEAILVLNAGSSSLKFSVFLDGEPPEFFLRGQVAEVFTEPRFVARDAAGNVTGEKVWEAGTQLGHQGAIKSLFSWGQGGALGGHRIVAAGHRVVHGGLKFTRPVVLDAEVLAALEQLVPLAPLHQPHNLAAIRAVARHAPQLSQVACFDTSFHRTQPAVAQAFALPRRYTAEGVCRYGFHGLSYEYVASVLPGLDARAADGRTVVAHLGNGASMCALRGGQSVASTMGFTALDGLPMGTRCGALDPGVLLYLMDRYGLDARALEKLLYQQSGLLGVSDASSDMRALLASEPNSRPRRSTCSSTASAASWARWPRPWAGWTRWCSPAASARTPRPSAPACAATPPGSAWSWTRRPTAPAARASAARTAASPPGSSRPTRS